MKFWDSSAIVPMLIEESTTSVVMDLYRDDPLLIVWWGTELECVSALARLDRQQGLPSASLTEALRRLQELKSTWQEIQPIDLVGETAIRLLRVHNLRAADSLQLAGAILASEHRPAFLDFVCLDERLLIAAQREGFKIPLAQDGSRTARNI